MMYGKRKIRPHQARRGFTMLEVVANVTACSLLLAFSIQVMSRSFGVHRDAMEHMSTIRSLQNLHDNLRRDVARAVEANTAENELRLVLEDDQQVVYRFTVADDQTRLVRRSIVQNIDMQEEDGRSNSGDSWALPGQSQLEFERMPERINCLVVDWLAHPVEWIFAAPSTGTNGNGGAQNE